MKNEPLKKSMLDGDRVRPNTFKYVRPLLPVPLEFPPMVEFVDEVASEGGGGSITIVEESCSLVSNPERFDGACFLYSLRGQSVKPSRIPLMKAELRSNRLQASWFAPHDDVLPFPNSFLEALMPSSTNLGGTCKTREPQRIF